MSNRLDQEFLVFPLSHQANAEIINYIQLRLRPLQFLFNVQRNACDINGDVTVCTRLTCPQSVRNKVSITNKFIVFDLVEENIPLKRSVRTGKELWLKNICERFSSERYFVQNCRIIHLCCQHKKIVKIMLNV